MKPGRQRLLIPGLLGALLVVVIVTAGVRRADADTQPVSVVPTTEVSTLDDPRITESSGLAASRRHRGIAYTVNDSGDAARVFSIDIASGRVVGVTSIHNARWGDAEALALRGGKLWVADVGNNAFSRKDRALYSLDEPGAGNHTTAATRYPLEFEGPPADIEALVALPSRIDLYVKGWPAGYALRLDPAELRADQPNVATQVDRPTPAFTTDATATADGRFVLLRNAAAVEVRDASSWEVVHRDAIPVQSRGETITMDPSGRSYLIGSEGSTSALLRAKFSPSDWSGEPVRTVDVVPQARAQQAVRLLIWQHRTALAVAAFAAISTLGLLVVHRRALRRTA